MPCVRERGLIENVMEKFPSGNIQEKNMPQTCLDIGARSLLHKPFATCFYLTPLAKYSSRCWLKTGKNMVPPFKKLELLPFGQGSCNSWFHSNQSTWKQAKKTTPYPLSKKKKKKIIFKSLLIALEAFFLA
jgi:hypothetical protein